MTMQYEEKEVLNSSFGYTLNTKNTRVGESIYGEFVKGENYFNKKFNSDATAAVFRCTKDFESSTGNATLREGQVFNIPGAVLADLFNKNIIIPGKHYRMERVETPAGKVYANWKVVSLVIVGEGKDDNEPAWS